MVKRKRKPIPLVPPPVKSRRRARHIVTTFHKLTREAEEVSSNQAPDKEAQLQRIRHELEHLGGREAYQSASLLSVSFHNTSKWVTQQLSKMGLRPGKGEPPLRVLEVGAINTRLLDVPWLGVRAIDLKSQHPRIEERDFFSLKPSEEYDVVSSSMVINCIPTAKQRGEMLKGYRKHLRPGGHLFLMLPVLCLTKSTRTTRASFEETLKAVGFRIRETRDSPKVAFFCAMAVEENPREADSRGDRCGIRNMTGSARLEDQQGVGTSQGRNKRSNRGCNDFEVVL
ncbi:unnamed protein product [Ascophyllum nodosum]